MTTPPDTPKPPADGWPTQQWLLTEAFLADRFERSQITNAKYAAICRMAAQQVSPQESHKLAEELERRITAYLVGGGLFNPELANHDAVRNLLMDCRDTLAALRSSQNDKS